MNCEEALRIRRNPKIVDVENDELSLCIDEALQLQVAREPLKCDKMYRFHHECPRCRAIVESHYNTKSDGTINYSWCDECGQKLKWIS